MFEQRETTSKQRRSITCIDVHVLQRSNDVLYILYLFLGVVSAARTSTSSTDLNALGNDVNSVNTLLSKNGDSFSGLFQSFTSKGSLGAPLGALTGLIAKLLGAVSGSTDYIAVTLVSGVIECCFCDWQGGISDVISDPGSLFG